MDKLGSIFVALWHKTRSLSPLVPLMLVAFLLALLLDAGNDVVGASSLFQSPLPSPTQEEPTATPSPTSTPEPTFTPTLPPTTPPEVATPTPALTPEPTETPVAPDEGGPAAPAETPAPPAETPGEAPEAAEPTPAPSGEEEAAPPPEESSPLLFNWGVFLNTVIIALSYLWICCGVCGLVGTPLAFILFYVGGKRRLRQRLEESEEDVEQS